MKISRQEDKKTRRQVFYLSSYPLILLSLLAIYYLLFSTLPVRADLISDGNTYLNKWQVEEGMEIAQKATREMPDKAESFWLLGKAYFYKGDYENALINISKALEIKEDTSWRRFFDFMKKTEEITKNFKTKESEHFILRYHEKDKILVSYVIDALEKGYKRNGQDLGYFPQRKVIVEIYPSAEDFNIASSLTKEQMEVSGAIGICKFARFMILSPRCLLFGYRWLDALAHEYTHFVIGRITKLNIPLWMNEGIAKFHETRWRTDKPKYLTPSCRNFLYFC